MKRNSILPIISITAVILVGTYLLFSINKSTDKGADKNFKSFSDEKIGLEFVYKIGKDGYVIEEIKADNANSDLMTSLVLTRTDDFENRENLPIGGEGPPTITILVFKNTQRLLPRVWVYENTQYSNINLKLSDITDVVTYGENAIRYRADGLYVSDNVVVAHRENIYVISGMYIEEESSIRKDFLSLIETIRFIPQSVVRLFYYDENKDRDENGNIECSRRGLVFVERNVFYRFNKNE